MRPVEASPAAGGAKPSARGLERLRDLALCALAVWACASARASFAEFVFEDSYITYRYAENLAAGRGFVFNPAAGGAEAERVLGTSTPLWTLLLAAGARASGAEVPQVASWLFPLAWTAAALLGAALLGGAGHRNLGALFALAVLWGAGGILLLWGMETALDLALLLGALLAARARRERLLGLLLGLAMLTRFDTVLFAGLLLAALAFAERRLPWRAFLVATAIVAPWLAFSSLYFGAPFPNTLSAKAGDESALAYLCSAAEQAGLTLFTPLLRFGRPAFASRLYWLFVPLILPLAFLARGALGRRPERWTLLLFPLALIGAYAWIGPPVEHTWHMLPGLLLLSAAGLLGWGELLGARERSRGMTLAVLLLIGLSAWQLGLRTAGEARAATSGAEYGRRVLAKAELAEVVRALGLERASLCAGEVGYLGWLTGCRMIDSTGLITPGVRGHGPLEERTSLDELAARFRPDLFLAPALGWPGLEGYGPLWESVRLRTLFAREELLIELAPELERLRAEPADTALPGAHDPWKAGAWNAGASGHGPSGWWSSADQRAFAEGDELFTAASIPIVLTSPAFRVDCDRLELELQAAGGAATRAELVVGGQIARRSPPADDAAWRRVAWSVSELRGRQAVLRLVDASSEHDVRARAITVR